MPLPQRRSPSSQSALLFTAAAVLVVATLGSVGRDVAAAPASSITIGDARHNAREAMLKTLTLLLKGWIDDRSRLTNAAPVVAQAEEEPGAESDLSEESDEPEELSTVKDADDNQDDDAELARQESDPGVAVEARGYTRVRDGSSLRSRTSSLRSSVTRLVGSRSRGRRPSKYRLPGARSRTSFGGGNVLHVVDKALTHADTFLGLVERLRNLFAPVDARVVHLPSVIENTNGGIMEPE